MRYKLIGLVAVAALLVTTAVAATLKTEHPTVRYHQHMEEPGYTPCTDHGGEAFCTHLPLVMIDTGGEEIPGRPDVNEDGHVVGYTVTGEETMLPASVRIVDNGNANNHPSDAAALASDLLIRVRGNSSRYFDKLGYLLRLTHGDGTYRNENVMGMDAHYEWTLHGPYLDKSLIRNYMWYNISGEIMDWAPNVRFCEVMINGEYQGLYVMTETITSGKNSRLDLSEPLPGTYKTGYVVRLDRGSMDPLKNIETFTKYTYRSLCQMDIQYPRAGSLTPELADAIAQDVSDFEKTLYSYDYDTDDYGYWHDVDVDEFVDYFILNEFTGNYDAGRYSTYLYKDVGGKLRPVVWDFNCACDNYQETATATDLLQLQDAPWYYMMTKDQYFNDKVLRRYAELRKAYLNEDYLDTYIDETLAWLGPAVDRNFEVWAGSFAEPLLIPERRDLRSHAAAVRQMKDFIHERGMWMDEHLEIIQQYSHESKVKKFNH